MRLLKIIFLLLLVAALPLPGISAAASAATAGHEAAGTVVVQGHEAGGHEGISAKAVELWNIGGFPITNSMLVMWIVAAGLILFAQLATRRMKLVPEGAQNFIEWLVESLYEFLEGVIGHKLVRKTFWFFASIFIFILFSNWMGLIPGVGTIGYGVHGESGFVISAPWFRGANADLNMTLAMSMTFFGCWIVWALQTNGPIGFLLHLFAPKGETTGLLKALMVVVFIAVGLLEVVSILFRPVSLSFRLFGNIFAGENMLESMSRLVPGWFGSIVIPIPFYFMEILVGLVQALVFMLLTAVFTMLICEEDEGHGAAHH